MLRATAAAEIYDPISDRFSRVGDLSRSPRIHPVAVVLQDGRVLITVLPSEQILLVGGYDERVRSYDDAWIVNAQPKQSQRR